MVEDVVLPWRNAVVLVVDARQKNRVEIPAEKIFHGIGKLRFQTVERRPGQHRGPALPADVDHPDRAALLEDRQRKMDAARARTNHRNRGRHADFLGSTAATSRIGSSTSVPAASTATAKVLRPARRTNAPVGVRSAAASTRSKNGADGSSNASVSTSRFRSEAAWAKPPARAPASARVMGPLRAKPSNSRSNRDAGCRAGSARCASMYFPMMYGFASRPTRCRANSRHSFSSREMSPAWRTGRDAEASAGLAAITSLAIISARFRQGPPADSCTRFGSARPSNLNEVN